MHSELSLSHTHTHACLRGGRSTSTSKVEYFVLRNTAEYFSGLRIINEDGGEGVEGGGGQELQTGLHF